MKCVFCHSRLMPGTHNCPAIPLPLTGETWTQYQKRSNQTAKEWRENNLPKRRQQTSIH